jgi:hypothetical protein
MTSDQRIAVEIAKEQNDLELAIKNGGLPSEAEAEGVEKALSRAHDDIESLTWRIEGIANGSGADVPFPVTLEHVGLLTILASDIESRADDLRHFAERIRKTLIWIDTIRVEQRRASDG